MQIEIPIFELMVEKKEKRKRFVKFYVKTDGKDYFKKQYSILKLPYVISCKLIEDKGFIVSEKKDFKKVKELIKKERMKILDIENVN
jgi:hypothetical protein